MHWEPKIDAVWVRLVAQELQRRGLDATPLLAEAGIPLQQIKDDTGRVSLRKSDHLFELAARATKDDFFGLRLGMTSDPRDLGLLAYLGLNSSTLLEAMTNFARYVSVLTDNYAIRLEPIHKGMMIHAALDNPADYVSKQANEAGMILLLQTYRLFAARQLTPLEVHFRHFRKASPPPHRNAFGCKIFFGSDYMGFLLKQDDLDIPLATGDSRLLKVLRRYCEAILAERHSNEPPFLTDVKNHIAGLLPKGRAGADLIASEMGMSSRTFLRRLREAGTTFHELRDNLRRDLARKYLEDPSLTTTEIAFLLGYSSPSAFSHSFKRLTGKTPSQMAEKL
ncbi:AraC family transcriptional regulator [Labrenzia sp. PHM005]|uniref:AraC family transcriptional regulator n=1 Tax=Labrenzia sp. PHM005 TaxID=2590016 RepID=UPI00143CEC35|nr:AraC family transcriptional regulator [Labrenzia sp. PHM005]